MSQLKFQLTFGAVSFPVSLEAAARAETISLNMMSPLGNRVSQRLVDSVTGEEVSRDGTRKAFEYEKGRYVTIDEEDLKKIVPQSAKVVVIESFVKGETIDPVFFESSYYVTPQEQGVKGYAVLYAVLKKTGKVAIAKATMHGREHVIAIRVCGAGLALHKLFYAPEVRSERGYRADVSAVSDKEAQMGEMLVEMMAAESFDPSRYHDAYKHSLRTLIDAKIEGKEFVTTAAPAQTKAAPDLMAQIAASLEMIRAKQSNAHADGGRLMPPAPIVSLLDQIVEAHQEVAA